MRDWLQSFIRGLGYEVRKAPAPDYQSVEVFDLALHYLIGHRDKGLTFIEVGANDGVFSDPLREYILNYPWTGVLIEPQPDVFERLQKNYAGLDGRVHFENLAISQSKEPFTMYRLPPGVSERGVYASGVASTDPKLTTRLLGVKKSALEELIVPSARLDDIVEKYGLHALDILQLDTEGCDWEVLQTLDLTKTRPWIIRFEHGLLSAKAIASITQHLNDHEYDVYYGGHESDSVALRRDFLTGLNGSSTMRSETMQPQAAVTGY